MRKTSIRLLSEVVVFQVPVSSCMLRSEFNVVANVYSLYIAAVIPVCNISFSVILVENSSCFHFRSLIPIKVCG